MVVLQTDMPGKNTLLLGNDNGTDLSHCLVQARLVVNHHIIEMLHLCQFIAGEGQATLDFFGCLGAAEA